MHDEMNKIKDLQSAKSFLLPTYLFFLFKNEFLEEMLTVHSLLRRLAYH